MVKNNKQLLDILIRVEWKGIHSDDKCPICGYIKTEQNLHAVDCVLNKYLTLSRKCEIIGHNCFRLIDKEEFLDLLYDIEQRVLYPTDIMYCPFCGEICDRVSRVNHSKKCILKQLISETESRYA